MKCFGLVLQEMRVWKEQWRSLSRRTCTVRNHLISAGRIMINLWWEFRRLWKVIQAIENSCQQNKLEDPSNSLMVGMEVEMNQDEEMRISGEHAEVIVRRIGFLNSCRVKAKDFAGVIWVFWKDTVHVEILDLQPQAIHMRIWNTYCFSQFLCTTIYVSPQPTKRKMLWEYLGSLAEQIIEPWVLARDFNAILDSSE
ncbi:hypothetical protein ES332_A02G065700v1 [Gossypium tomentosum]|uniref:DUF4283 domain-containing protein n=1 Tax=Gossypium tomentosum TaxID=34277 RepID=A0A5D2RGS9_GOSTO|nr:hypothetical protein ES332_A02G065700v1 [Gossypium tomentosum]